MKKLIERAATLSGVEIYEHQSIEISFVGPRTIARVNEDYVGHTGITDVISFNYQEHGMDEELDTGVEIIICVDFAVSEAEERNDSSYEDELILYVVHGLLHAAGEDDLDDISCKQMRRREKEVITDLKKEFNFSDIISLRKKL